MSDDTRPKSLALITRGGARVESDQKEATPKSGSKTVKTKPPRAPAAMKLGPVGRKEFARLVQALSSRNKYDERFETGLALWCVSYETFLNAKDKVAEKGAVYEGPNGGLVYSPWQAVMSQAAGQMIQIGKEYGLTLMSAARVNEVQLDMFDQAPKPKEESDNLYANKGGGPA